VDPDIVLINIEKGDRAFIGKLLLKVDSFKPLLIGLDAWFTQEKPELEDSVLVNAFKNVQNDFLTFALDSNGRFIKSHRKFSKYVTDEGIAMGNVYKGLQNSFTPVMKIDEGIYEHFALKIVRHWKTHYKTEFKPNKSYIINFTRTLDQFFHFNGSDIDDIDGSFLKNKIVLFGFIGPGNEDKHFTPIRLDKKYSPEDPDTYGLVIIANEIRTLLDMKN
jgi:hypothetical protein